jgi:hypothetical protein
LSPKHSYTVGDFPGRLPVANSRKTLPLRLE